MHHSPHEIKDKLLKALDKDNNVVDMELAMEVISLLERTPITKEALEATRLGKYINEMRKKTHNEILARRAKDLVRRWRDMVVTTKPTENGTGGTGPGPGAGGGAVAAAYNNNNKHSVTPPVAMLRPVASSPALTSLQRAGGGLMSSPALTRPSSRNTKPVISPALRQVASSPAFKPILSPEFASSASTSPSLSFSAHSSRPTTPSTAAMIRSRVISPGPGRPVTVLSQLSPASPVSVSNLSSYAPKMEGVAKTHAANKRLRKEDGEDELILPENKRPRTANGMDWMDEESRESASSLISVDDKTPLVVEESSSSVLEVQEKKQRRGRKPNEATRKEGMSDVLRQKFASIARTPKVKTTQQLLEDLAKRSGSPSLASKAETLTVQQETELQEVNRVKQFAASSSRWDVKGDSLSKLWKSQTGPVDGASDVSAANERLPVAPIPVKIESVEDILAKLPPIDPTVLEEIEDVGEEGIARVETVVNEEAIERLHTEPSDHVNGTRDYQNQFREWHETLSVPSYQGNLLHLLPYCVID